jgi:hypothetical protein
MSTASPIKNEALRIVEQLPDNATWEDLIYRIYVRQSIEAGLKGAYAPGYNLPSLRGCRFRIRAMERIGNAGRAQLRGAA